MDITTLLGDFMKLGGFAALVSVLVDIGKRFGIVKDGDAPTWVTGINLVGLVIFFVAKVVNFDFAGLDPVFAQVATVLAALLALVGQVAVSRFAHFTLQGVKVIRFSHPKA